jgi:two-component system, NarL family, capsular synthesis sensor histidine kinase RcsC
MASELNVLPRALSLAVHELRTPITVASGYLRMMLREQAGPITDKQRKMLEEADKSCARIGALIAEMSELGKLEAGEVTVSSVPFDLAALIASLAGSMHEGEDRGVRLDVRATHPVMVAGDRTRLATALSALMHAALRERGEPGVIVVECSSLPDTSQAWAIVTIGDETVIPSLADAARTTPPAFDEWRGGLGLALPVGRRVIEAHGGALWSAPGNAPRAGSALRLPLAN